MGKAYLEEKLHREPRVFVAGRYSVGNNTIRALITMNFTHDCTAIPHYRSKLCDWSRLPRICMPYHPHKDDYQISGDVPLLIIPVSRFFPYGTMSPELAPFCGVSWLKACFREYYRNSSPVFHICLHSPSMTDSYFRSVMDKLLDFISSHQGISFRFASEVESSLAGELKGAKASMLPYMLSLNKSILRAGLRILLRK